MALELEDMMRKIALPKRYFNNEFIISDKFQEEIDTFVLLLHQCNGEEFTADKSEIIKIKVSEIISAVKLNKKSILNIIKHYENADLKAAQEEFDALMSRIEDDIFIGTIDDYVQVASKEKTMCRGFRLTPGYQYFRVRPIEDEINSITQNADELFHIPLSKRAYVNNERFSLAGFPSLYLSTMLPLAWQECGYPQKYYYSEYQYEYSRTRTFEDFLSGKELRLLSLYSPDEICNWGIAVKYNSFNVWLDVYTRYLKTHPLILACSFVNQSGKVPYKQEYIIPQMLMQWVQRNNSKVQGISYFTCLDTSMWTSKWCAYNIVIPATEPHDDKKYSEKLREKFNWTMPQFYTVPVADKMSNEHDREIIYNLQSDIRSAINTFRFPAKLQQLLYEMMSISGCLMSLLEDGSFQQMQLVLHTLNYLKSNCIRQKIPQYDAFINQVFQDEQDTFITNNQNINDLKDTIKNLYNRLVGNEKHIESIEKIIDKHEHLCWNDLHPHSQIILLYTDDAEITEPIKWLRKNHILYSLLKLDSSDKTVEYMKKITTEAEISIRELWDASVENDEWIKTNIGKVKTPIFVKQNNTSILSPDGTKFYEFVQVGFDKDHLAEKLHLS